MEAEDILTATHKLDRDTGMPDLMLYMFLALNYFGCMYLTIYIGLRMLGLDADKKNEK